MCQKKGGHNTHNDVVMGGAPGGGGVLLAQLVLASLVAAEHEHRGSPHNARQGVVSTDGVGEGGGSWVLGAGFWTSHFWLHLWQQDMTIVQAGKLPDAKRA
jgi:hypothetical protein